MQPSSGQEQGVADDDTGCDAGVPSTIASKLASLRAQVSIHNVTPQYCLVLYIQFRPSYSAGCACTHTQVAIKELPLACQ
jgi:hypothetical protein